jgi:hypothetical protein
VFSISEFLTQRYFHFLHLLTALLIEKCGSEQQKT